MRDWRKPPTDWFWRHCRDRSHPPIVAEQFLAARAGLCTRVAAFSRASATVRSRGSSPAKSPQRRQPKGRTDETRTDRVSNLHEAASRRSDGIG